MLLTNVLLKKAKTKLVLALCESMVSGHRVYLARERIADKLEFFRWDPLIRQESVYKEIKKMKGVKGVKDLKPPGNPDQYKTSATAQLQSTS